MGGGHHLFFHSNVAASGIHGFPFDERAEFWTQCFIGDEVDRTTQEILHEELNPEKSVRGCWRIEADENVNIAVQVRGVARHGAKQRQAYQSESLREGGCALREKLQYLRTIHDFASAAIITRSQYKGLQISCPKAADTLDSFIRSQAVRHVRGEVG